MHPRRVGHRITRLTVIIGRDERLRLGLAWRGNH